MWLEDSVAMGKAQCIFPNGLALSILCCMTINHSQTFIEGFLCAFGISVVETIEGSGKRTLKKKQAVIDTIKVLGKSITSLISSRGSGEAFLRKQH